MPRSILTWLVVQIVNGESRTFSSSIMNGLKCVFLFSLVASAFVSCNAEVDSLDSLLRRVIAGIKAENAQTAGGYIQRLTSGATKADGKTAIDRISVLDKQDGTLLASGGQGAVPLSAMQRNAIVSAFTSGRFDSFQTNGLTVGDRMYRVAGTPSADGVVTLVSRNGTINMKKANFGIVVVQSPKGGMTAAVDAMKTTTK
ncbi:uncharacterized protein LOC110983997 [Acanthaster planci]|uniref:Uncharacterized protein LOC110983997 n=1 Tax=Acanthaster planci TaxID=133434 RepID=A0A8B7Z3V0_ACAPL|nr:uncharacterized protein LOC110983997 [Acanthaster planci]